MSKTDKPKTAYGEVRSLVKSFLDETEGNPKVAKSHQRMEAVYAALEPIKAQINEKTAKIVEAREAVKEMQNVLATRDEEVALLREELEKEPKLEVIQIRRMASAFTGVTEAVESTPYDNYYVKSKSDDVLSRLMPIADPESGVVGFKIMLNDNASNVVMIPAFISSCELRAGRDFDVDNNAGDALMVYQEALTVAFAIADAYTMLYGQFKVIPFDNQHAEESNKILTGYNVVGTGTVVRNDDSDSEEEEEDIAEGDESDIESDDDGVDELTAEQLAERVASEDDENPDDVDAE